MLRVVVAVAVATSLSACATVVRGTAEQVAFVSEPPGAIMSTNSKYACPATPCTLSVERSDQFDATFSKAGYQPQTIPVRTQISGGGAAGAAGNIILGGVIGLGVDAVSGATLDHTPNPVVAVLQPLAGAKPARPARRAKRAPAT